MNRLPVIIYLAVYLFTFLIGAVFLLSGNEEFENLVHIFTGIVPYHLNSDQLLVDVLLAFAAPLLFITGLVWQTRKALTSQLPLKSLHNPPPWAIYPLFVFSLAIAFISLLRGGALGMLGSWLDYQSWVSARWTLFRTLSFVEFVNIYSVLPISVAMVMVQATRLGSRPRVRYWLPLVTMVIVDVLVYQKKTLIVSLIIVFASLFVSKFGPSFASSRVRVWHWGPITAFGSTLYFVYVILVVLPSLSESSRPMQVTTSPRNTAIGTGLVKVTPPPVVVTTERESTISAGEGIGVPITGRVKGAEKVPGPKKVAAGERLPAGTAAGLVKTDPVAKPVEGFTITSRRLRATAAVLLPPRWIGGDPDRIAKTSAAARREVSLFVFAAVAPLIRTPIPALLYPAVYPSEVGYYGFDMGLDIFGMGRSPDDNLVIDRKLWPGVEGGSVTAPFQFGLYSQIGLGGTLLFSLAVGALLGRIWTWILSRALTLLTGPVLAGVALLFIVLLAIDSLRNNVIVSYGLFWAVAFLAFYHGLEFIYRSYRSRLH